MKPNHIIQAIIGILALLVGYPRGGSLFVLLMIPLVIYLIIRKDAGFLPALMLHCASDTSIAYAVFWGMMIMCIINSRIIWKDPKTRFIFLVLLSLFPLYVWLLYQKVTLDYMLLQRALYYTTYYITFWGFLYCYLISGSFNRNTVKLILVAFLIMWLISTIFPDVRHARVFFMTVFLGVVYGAYLLYLKKRILGILTLLVFFPLFYSSGEITFTELLVLLYALTIFILWSFNKNSIVKKSVSIAPYLVIFVLMIYGINNYDNVVVYAIDDKMDFSDWKSFSNRAQYKFFGDRAIYWDASWKQLVEYKPILPLHNIPNISTYSILTGKLLDDLEYGAHNTPLQLLRIFGFLMGSLLIVIYIYITVISSNIFITKSVKAIMIPLFAVVFADVVILFLTGTAVMLSSFALFSFGLLGVAYGISKDKDATLIKKQEYEHLTT